VKITIHAEIDLEERDGFLEVRDRMLVVAKGGTIVRRVDRTDPLEGDGVEERGTHGYAIDLALADLATAAGSQPSLGLAFAKLAEIKP
jgi:hypothetical protein